MFDSFGWVLNSVALIRCLQTVWGKQKGFRKNVISLFPTLMGAQFIIKDHSVVEMLLICAITYMSSRIWLNRSRKETLANTLVFATVFYSIKYVIYGIITMILPHAEEDIFLDSVLTFIFVFVLLPFFRPERITCMLLKGRGTMVLMTLCATILLFVLMYHEAIRNENNELISVVTVPMTLLFLWALSEDFSSERKVGEMEETIHTGRLLQEEYDKNIEGLRVRQHSFKNQMIAMQAAMDSDDKKAREYYENLMSENEYNKILLTGNPVLGGFVYSKLMDIREMGTMMESHVSGVEFFNHIPPHRATEIMGIMLDNAKEELAAQGKDGYFELHISDGAFIIRNTVTNHVTHQDVNQWFASGWSTKGKGRGLGLPRLKDLAKKYDYDICCRCYNEKKREYVEIGIVFPNLKP